MKKILIVDDQKSIREGLEHALRYKGFDVYSAASGEDALKYIIANNIDIMVSDLRMPGISGLELVSEIRLKNYPIKVILISAYFTTEDAVSAVKFGVSDLYPKPFDIKELTDKVVSLSKNVSFNEDSFSQSLIQKSSSYPLKCVGGRWNLFTNNNLFSLSIIKKSDNEELILITYNYDDYDRGFINSELNFVFEKDFCLNNFMDLSIQVKNNNFLDSGIALLRFFNKEKKIEYSLRGQIQISLLNINQKDPELKNFDDFGEIVINELSLMILQSDKQDLSQSIFQQISKNSNNYKYNFNQIFFEEFSKNENTQKNNYAFFLCESKYNNTRKVLYLDKNILSNTRSIQEGIDSLNISLNVKVDVYTIMGHILSLLIENDNLDGEVDIYAKDTHNVNITLSGFAKELFLQESLIIDDNSHTDCSIFNNQYFESLLQPIFEDHTNESLFRISG